MKKAILFFKRTDETIFEQLEFFKRSSAYEEFWDKLDSLSGGQGKIVAQVLSVVLVLLPFVIAMFFWWENLTLKNSLEVRRKITQTIYDYKAKNNVVMPLKSSGASGMPLKSKEDFVGIINISPGKNQDITIKKIKNKKISKNLGRSRVLLSFQNFTTDSLVNMLKNLSYQHKARVSQVHIKKDKVLKTLGGEMELIFYSVGETVEKDKNEAKKNK